MGMLLGAGHAELASGAMLLLAVNVVSVIVSARLVFMAKGLQPRTWHERSKARQSTLVAAVFWAVLLAVLLVIVLVRHRVVM
jgi:uncharacterized membrane protein